MMQLFIEIKGGQGVGKTTVLENIRIMLENEFHINWRQQDAPFNKEDGIPREQVICDLGKRK